MLNLFRILFTNYYFKLLLQIGAIYVYDTVMLRVAAIDILYMTTQNINKE